MHGYNQDAIGVPLICDFHDQDADDEHLVCIFQIKMQMGCLLYVFSQ